MSETIKRADGTEVNERRREDLCRRYRVFPRLAFMMFLAVTYEVVKWFIHLGVPTVEQSGFATGMVVASVGFFKFFMSEGKGE